MRFKFIYAGVMLVMMSACAPDIQLTSDAPSPPLESALVPVAPPSTPATVLATGNSTLATVDASPTPDDVPQADTASLPGVLYDVTAILDWEGRTVQVSQSVTYRNDTGLNMSELVFNVDSNRDSGVFALHQIAADQHGPISDYLLEDNRLAVRLPTSLVPGHSVALTLEFELTLSQIRSGYRWGHLGYLGFSLRQVNLGMWLPLVAAFDPGTGWITPQFHSVGEHFVLRQANFVVELSVIGAGNGIHVVGPGDVTRVDNHTWRFALDGAREIALSISPNFRTLSTDTASGAKVELSYLPDSLQTSLECPRHALQTAADALALYEDLYGPYPFERLAVVEGDFPDGMEFSGLVFVSSDWFRAWQGAPNDWLTLITAHEVSHQWWYAQVGNDQGYFPYLDEALATFSEVLFFEHYYPEHVQWWWEFRVQAHTPLGYVDTTIYDFEWVREYIDAVYLRGALLMDGLRSDLGDEAFLAWLKAYAQTMRGEIAGPEDFWGMLSSDQLDATRETRAGFLREDGLLFRSDSVP